MMICMNNPDILRKIIRVLPKGQITLPLSIRERFHIESDDILELISMPDSLILKPLGKEQNFLKKLRGGEWGRHKEEIGDALMKLTKLPSKKLPKLCR